MTEVKEATKDKETKVWKANIYDVDNILLICLPKATNLGDETEHGYMDIDVYDSHDAVISATHETTKEIRTVIVAPCLIRYNLETKHVEVIRTF